MAIKNIKSIITFAGKIDATLPSAAGRAAKKLRELNAAQRADQIQLKELKLERQSLTKGTQEYADKTAQIATVQKRIDFRAGEMAKAGRAARTAAGGITTLGGAFTKLAGPVGIILTALAGFIGLAKFASNQGDKFKKIDNIVAQTGVSYLELERNARFALTVVGNIDEARKLNQNFAMSIDDMKYAYLTFGRVGQDQLIALSHLGIRFNDVLEAQTLTDVVNQIKDSKVHLMDSEMAVRHIMHGYNVDLDTATNAWKASRLEGERLEDALRRMGATKVVNKDQRELLKDMNTTMSEISVTIQDSLIPATQSLADNLNLITWPIRQVAETSFILGNITDIGTPEFKAQREMIQNSELGDRFGRALGALPTGSDQETRDFVIQTVASNQDLNAADFNKLVTQFQHFNIDPRENKVSTGDINDLLHELRSMSPQATPLPAPDSNGTTPQPTSGVQSPMPSQRISESREILRESQVHESREIQKEAGPVTRVNPETHQTNVNVAATQIPDFPPMPSPTIKVEVPRAPDTNLTVEPPSVTVKPTEETRIESNNTQIITKPAEDKPASPVNTPLERPRERQPNATAAARPEVVRTRGDLHITQHFYGNVDREIAEDSLERIDQELWAST